MWEVGVAHVWFQCYGMTRDVSKNAPKTLLQTPIITLNLNPTPAPTYQLSLEKIRRFSFLFFWKKNGVGHTKSHSIKYFPI